MPGSMLIKLSRNLAYLALAREALHWPSRAGVTQEGCKERFCDCRARQVHEVAAGKSIILSSATKLSVSGNQCGWLYSKSKSLLLQMREAAAFLVNRHLVIYVSAAM